MRYISQDFSLYSRKETERIVDFERSQNPPSEIDKRIREMVNKINSAINESNINIRQIKYLPSELVKSPLAEKINFILNIVKEVCYEDLHLKNNGSYLKVGQFLNEMGITASEIEQHLNDRQGNNLDIIQMNCIDFLRRAEKDFDNYRFDLIGTNQEERTKKIFNNAEEKNNFFFTEFCLMVSLECLSPLTSHDKIVSLFEKSRLAFPHYNDRLMLAKYFAHLVPKQVLSADLIGSFGLKQRDIINILDFIYEFVQTKAIFSFGKTDDTFNTLIEQSNLIKDKTERMAFARKVFNHLENKNINPMFIPRDLYEISARAGNLICFENLSESLRDNKDYLYNLFKNNPEAFDDMNIFQSDEFEYTEMQYEAALKSGIPSAWRSAPKHLFTKEVAEEAVKNNPSIYDFIPSEFKQDPTILSILLEKAKAGNESALQNLGSQLTKEVARECFINSAKSEILIIDNLFTVEEQRQLLFEEAKKGIPNLLILLDREDIKKICEENFVNNPDAIHKLLDIFPVDELRQLINQDENIPLKPSIIFEVLKDNPKAAANYLKEYPYMTPLLYVQLDKPKWMLEAIHFAQMVLVTDDYFSVKTKDSEVRDPAARFFEISKQLPMELQSSLASKAAGSPKNSPISSLDFEWAARYLIWQRDVLGMTDRNFI